MGPWRLTVLALSAVLALAACVPAAAPAAPSTPPTTAALAATTSTVKARAFHDAMRKLWEDHVTWTRLYLVSAIAGLPDTAPTAERLLRNQADIGDAIKPYYGDAAGTKLTGLLTDHIKIAVDVVAAAKAGDTAKFNAANTRWYANMDDISAFLSGANPKAWPLEQVRPMMRMHLDLTLAEASARLKGQWADDVNAYERVHVHILQLADQLSAGVMAQFADRFAD